MVGMPECNLIPEQGVKRIALDQAGMQLRVRGFPGRYFHTQYCSLQEYQQSPLMTSRREK